ncbi:HAMP domain-containing sensor histidine kinase [Mastigocoleus sp. MO_188.B34]|uniref:sensor histidine kinase n=1 Tax=Mastigocoleus sp. MO_188.B34 TaxID=3036635 RepID=UPI00261396E5|nr:HAMP domain-containing sensor histidine kinase [Mastigocoleus sp. MO_188.B34]MDJ0692891.1 HAMP domain-containing sensor histidine kinase [Mastigocoleus sp. MO_188.B34]
MFQKTRYKLLFSYITVFTIILGIFTVTVRIFFIQSLKQELIQKLIILSTDEAHDAKLEGGLIKIRSDFPTEELIAHKQTLEWFDLQGKLIQRQGKYDLNLPFSPQNNVKYFQLEETELITFTLSMRDINSSRHFGYVRVSQSLEDFKQTVQKLDLGLAGGIVIAVIFSSIGGMFLTHQSMRPIEKSFQRLKQFTADASHELRSPLMAIKSNAAVALKYPEAMRPKDIEKFEAIASAVSQMTDLTEDLLFLARSDTYDGSTKNENLARNEWDKFDLGITLAELLQLYQPQALDRKIHLKTRLNNNLYLLGNVSQVRRVFRNLIDNALHYTPSGGKIEVRTSIIKTNLGVEVEDTGIGIAPEDLERVFDRFWRANQSRSYRDNGSGLGLAISKAIVENHGGSITVTSKLGIGSCFSVRLPLLS